jgi:hypothetical protein
VTITTSNLGGQLVALPDLKHNHATIANEDMGSLVLNLIRSIQPMQ